jgi:hypothetical protein
MFFADVLPAQHEDFVTAGPGEREQANGGYHPWGAALVLRSLAQGITQAAKFGLTQETLAPSLAVFLDVPAGIGAIGPEAMLLSPSKKT